MFITKAIRGLNYMELRDYLNIFGVTNEKETNMCFSTERSLIVEFFLRIVETLGTLEYYSAFKRK